MKKCSHCSFETKKTSNLKRHVQRFHGPDLVKNVQPKQGFCLRFECGQTFHRIRDLQRHLISSRNHKLHFETKAFNSFQVNCLIQYFSFKPSARQHFFHFTKRVLGKFSPGQSPPRWISPDQMGPDKLPNPDLTLEMGGIDRGELTRREKTLSKFLMFRAVAFLIIRYIEIFFFWECIYIDMTWLSDMTKY